MVSRVQRRVLLLGVVCAAGLTATVSASANTAHAASGKTVVVTLHNFQFNPPTEKIAPGTTIKWHWEDGAGGAHNITSLHKKGGLTFKGTGVRTSGFYSVKFTKAGTYYYECSVHPLTMQAKIVVK
jgi:plastocyanin